MPRNFPGHSGTRDGEVCLVIAETAAASGLTSVITDPRGLDMEHPRIKDPDNSIINHQMLVAPLPPAEARDIVFLPRRRR